MSRVPVPPSMAGVGASPARLRVTPRVLWLAALLLGALAAGGLVHVRGSGSPVPGPPARPPGLADLWSGRASLVLARRITSTSLGQPQGGGYSGSHIAIAGARWYLFNRFSVPAPGCRRGTALGTQVRASTDRGRTWGRPTPAVAPTAGTPWACAATDGDAVFDAATGTWR